MTERHLAGLMLIIGGLLYTLFADRFGRYQARPFKANPRPFQKFTYFLGLGLMLIGIITVVFGK